MTQLDFCFDHLSDPDLGYPNLAQRHLTPDQFDVTWPRTLPVRLFAYFPLAGMQHRTWRVQDAPPGSWYPIGLAWHDFGCDYFDLLSDATRQRVRDGCIRVLFYYHEGDNPQRIKQRMDERCEHHGLPPDCYVFVSANSAARGLVNFYYLSDHELFFRYVNRHQRIPVLNADEKPYQFTAVNRSHKWWRATIMTDLLHSGLLKQSLWSYNTECLIGDAPEDNPLILADIPRARQHLHDFLAAGPYWCDGGDSNQHNDHQQVNLDLYLKSYVHLVMETHFDADQSAGTFLTEKTYKCLKFGQPFVIFGPQHSLQTLRDRGYRTFDHCIDHGYDNISDNTERYQAAWRVVHDLAQQDLHAVYRCLLPDLMYNQDHFISGDVPRLTALVQHLHQLSTVTS